jgi:subtilisin family serine protease
MDQYRWYLQPNGQEILISIDDLHDETVVATPEMDWGYEALKGLKLKKAITIAVVDGGIDITHPELKNNIAYNAAECFEGTIIPPKDGEDKDGNGYKGDCAGWNFVKGDNRAEDLDGHGTHVTGIIRSTLAGVEGELRFLPLNVFAPGEGLTPIKDVPPLPQRLQKAFEYALARKVDVIHLSVGWPKSYMTPELEKVIKDAMKGGVAVVAAAGNSSQRASIYPCQIEGVLCVGAMRANGEVARFSNWGPQVDIFAPGEKILSTIPRTVTPLHISRKGYDYKNGTSQAAPFISAAMALLRGLYPEASLAQLQARLLSTALAPRQQAGLTGQFQLARAITQPLGAYVKPELKGINSLTLNPQGLFTLELPFKNLGAASRALAWNVNCNELGVIGKGNLAALSSEAIANVKLTGRLTDDVTEVSCTIAVGSEKFPVKWKVLNTLPQPSKTINVRQTTPLVVETRLGTRSRFLTVAAVKGHTPESLYYVPGKEVNLYREDQHLGVLPVKEGCNFLRVWQLNLDGEGENEIMLESMCNKQYLEYQFLTQELSAVTPAAQYKPSLTILNYEDFTISYTAGVPPTFRFLGSGFTEPTPSPWDNEVIGRAEHYYELKASQGAEGWSYGAKLLEDPQSWARQLGLRFLPDYQVLYEVSGRLLVKLGQKSAWVDIATQKAQWANLDHLMLAGGRKQRVWGTDDFVLQTMLTPYDYRGFVVSGVTLRFQQSDRFDPLLDVVATQKNAQGYLTVIRTFQRLIYLQFDTSGKLVNKTASVVDRFDFLSTQDLIATVVNLPVDGDMVQVVDGSKVNTNYVDVARDGVMKSFALPQNCVTHLPVVADGVATLPVFCSRSNEEFEMRFIEL